jgi:hypothetical protein
MAHPAPGDTFQTVDFDIDAGAVGHIKRSNIFYSSLTVAASATSELTSILETLMSNEYQHVEIKSVTLSVKIENKRSDAELTEISTPKSKYEPGETVPVQLKIKPYNQPVITRTINVVIPNSAPNGSATISIGGSGGSLVSLGGFVIDLSALLGSSSSTEAEGLDQQIRKFLQQPKNNQLEVKLQLGLNSIEIGGKTLNNPSPNIQALLKATSSSSIHQGRAQIKRYEQTDWIVSGSKSISLVIAKKDPLDTASPQSGINYGSFLTASPAQTAAAIAAATAASNASDDSGLQGDDYDYIGQAASRNPLHRYSASTPEQSLPMLNVATPQVTILDTEADQAGDASPDSDAEDDSDESASAPEKPKKPVPVTRQPQSWRQDSEKQFITGAFDNFATTNRNTLVAASTPKYFASIPESPIWATINASGGAIYVSAGTKGNIYKVDASGSVSLFFATKHIAVTALAFANNTLYAGAAPHADLYKIDEKGTGEIVFSAAPKNLDPLSDDGNACYIDALQIIGSRIFIAAANPNPVLFGALLSNISAASPILSPKSGHIISLAAPENSDHLFAATSPDNVVYEVSLDANQASPPPKVVYSAQTGQNITGIAANSRTTPTENNLESLYVALSPRGGIVRVTTAKQWKAPEVKSLLSKDAPAITALAQNESGVVFGIGGQYVYSIQPDGIQPSIVNSFRTSGLPDDVILTKPGAWNVQLSGISASQNLVTISDNEGKIWGLPVGAPGAATYTSAVHDAKQPSSWGAVHYETTPLPNGWVISLETRSGDKPDPATGWSAWEPIKNDRAASPPARFIQYRLSETFPKGVAQAADSGKTSSILSVSIDFLTRNQPPLVKFVEPQAGDSISGDVKVKWRGTDPDHDTLAYDLYYSTNGIDWTLIPADPEKPKKDADADKKPASDTGAHPVIDAKPKDKAKTTQKPATALAKPAQQDAKPLAKPATTPAPPAPHQMSQSQTWKTDKLPKAVYQLKIVASDAPSNGTDALTDSAIIGGLTLDNSPPVVKMDDSSIKYNKKCVTISGSASSSFAVIVAVQYKIDDSPNWLTASPIGGFFDAKSVDYVLTTDPISSGKHKITIEAITDADKAGDATTSLTIP